VETIAKQSRLAEHEVARQAIQRAHEGAAQTAKMQTIAPHTSGST
jgi:hypothetical protein